jgi:hypothetical protein
VKFRGIFSNDVDGRLETQSKEWLRRPRGDPSTAIKPGPKVLYEIPTRHLFLERPRWEFAVGLNHREIGSARSLGATPQWAKQWHQRDPRRLYYAGTGWNRPEQVTGGAQVAGLVRFGGGELRNVTGYLRPSNHRIFRHDAARNGVAGINGQLARACGKFQLACARRASPATRCWTSATISARGPC